METEESESAPVQLDGPERLEPVARMVRDIIRRAIAERANHLRVEPSRGSVRITCTVRGNSIQLGSLPRTLQIPLTESLRTMAGLKPRGKGCSEEGEFWAHANERDYHLTLFTEPGEFGEGIVILLPA